MNTNTHSGAAKLSLLLEVDERVGGVGGGHFSSDSCNSARKFQQHLMNIGFQLFLMIYQLRLSQTPTYSVSGVHTFDV